MAQTRIRRVSWASGPPPCLTCIANPRAWRNSTPSRTMRLRWRLKTDSIKPVVRGGWRRGPRARPAPLHSSANRRCHAIEILSLLNRDLAQQLEVAEHFAGTEDDAAERIIGNRDR